MAERATALPALMSFFIPCTRCAQTITVSGFRKEKENKFSKDLVDSGNMLPLEDGNEDKT